MREGAYSLQFVLPAICIALFGVFLLSYPTPAHASLETNATIEAAPDTLFTDGFDTNHDALHTELGDLHIDEFEEDFSEEFGLYLLPIKPRKNIYFSTFTAFENQLDPLFKELFGDIENFFGTTLGVIPRSAGPFAPITFDPALVTCPVLGIPPQGGGPFVGTHNDCKNSSSGSVCSGSWQSENGTDWIYDDGEPLLHPVLALIGGVLSDSKGTGGCGPGFGETANGFRMYLCGDDGNIYYMAHMDPSAVFITEGQRVSKGQVLALLLPKYRHLHMAIAGSFNCSSCSNLPSYDDPSIYTWDAWYKCCNGREPGVCTSITPPVLPPGSGGGGGGGSGSPRPIPDPFSCVAPDVSSCLEPPLTQNVPGLSQERCVPFDPECNSGICFGLCKDKDGALLGNAGALDDINEDPNPIATLAVLDPDGGDYCAYSVSDRCGDPSQGGACAFTLECETHRACNAATKQCELRDGRQLTSGEVGCESDADCVPTHSVCRGPQCVAVASPGENECGSDVDCASPRGYHYTCISNADLGREFDLSGNPLFSAEGVEPRGAPAGPQCALIPCPDGIACADTCSTDFDCGLTEITPLPLPPTIPPISAIVCGDGICDSGEEDSCPVDCALEQDALPVFPGGGSGGTGTVIPTYTCSDESGDGAYDSCSASGESTILCESADDCTRVEHSQCASLQCLVINGPGINACGDPTNPSSLNDESCTASSTNTCGGKYDPLISRNPAGENFGDASCSFSKAALFNELVRIDCAYANFWMDVASGESAFNPNITAPVSTSGSAWGLFQMGHDARDFTGDGDMLDCAEGSRGCIGSPDDNGISENGINDGPFEWIRPPRATSYIHEPKQMNNQFDGGDTPWATQAFNAVSYNNRLRSNGNQWCYWSVAKNLLGGQCRGEPSTVTWPSAC